MPRNLSHAFASKAGEQAAIAKFSQRRAAAMSSRSQVQAKQHRIILAIVLVAACVLAALAFRIWSSVQTDDAVHAQLEEAQRAALRFGEIRIPVGRNTCTAMALDNASGVVTAQNTVPCFELPEAPPPPVASDNPGPAARAKAMANAFKR